MKFAKKLPEIRLTVPLTILAAVLLAGFITLLALWCQPNSFRTVVVPCLLRMPVIIIMNALPVGLLLLFFTCLFSNVFYGAAVTNLIVGGLSIANRIKIEIRDEPLFPRDFALLKEAADAASKYHIDYPVKFITAVAAVSLLLAVLGLVFRQRPFPIPRLRGWPGRLLGAAASVGVLALLIVTAYRSNNPLSDFLTRGISVSNPYRLSTVFNETGFPYNFCHQFTTYLIDEPEGFSKSQAAAWETGSRPGQGAPVHVVMVMDEGFSDITDYDVFTYGEEDDPLRNLHALREDPHAVAGQIVVPGFCGGTANTEFDVLTGIQSNAISATTTSAMRVVNRNLDSLFRVFGGDGYRTSFFHPGDDWFYNRENVYRWLGAEKTRFADEMEDIRYKGSGGWVSDEYMARQILQEFEETVSNGGLLFHYTTTIQNHMSYTEDKYGEGFVFPPLQTSTALSPEAESILKVYVEGVRDADALLGDLVSYFSATDEPVLLAFWGDHRPYLGENLLCYYELGVDAATDENVQYRTPYVIWANDAAAETLDWENAVAALELPENRHLSAAFFGATVLELTGRRDENPWFSFLCGLRRSVPVVQKDTYADSDGALHWIGDLEDPDILNCITQWRRWAYYKLKYQEVG